MVAGTLEGLPGATGGCQSGNDGLPSPTGTVLAGSKPQPAGFPLPPVNATVRLRSADTTYGSCHTLPTSLDYGN